MTTFHSLQGDSTANHAIDESFSHLHVPSDTDESTAEHARDASPTLHTALAHSTLDLLALDENSVAGSIRDIDQHALSEQVHTTKTRREIDDTPSSMHVASSENEEAPRRFQQNRTLNQLVRNYVSSIPLTPQQYADKLIAEKWGNEVPSHTTLMVTLHHEQIEQSPGSGIHKGKVARSQTLNQALLSDDRKVGDGQFEEGWLGNADDRIGPQIALSETPSSAFGFDKEYEGIYRQAVPPHYGPANQVTEIRASDFKKWVSEVNFRDKYLSYLKDTQSS